MLNEMVLCEELFHTPSGVAFADFRKAVIFRWMASPTNN
jgi:hypothetical protein